MAEILHFEILRKHGQTNTQTHKHTNKQTNKHTNRHGHYNTSPSPYGGEVNMHAYVYLDTTGYTPIILEYHIIADGVPNYE